MFTQIGMWLKIRHFLTNGYKTVKFQSNLLKIAKHFVISLYYTHKKNHMNQMNRTIFTGCWITGTVFLLKWILCQPPSNLRKPENQTF